MSMINTGRGRVHWLTPLITLSLLLFEMISAPDARLSTWLRRQIAAEEPTLPSLTETSWQALLGSPASHVTARASKRHGGGPQNILSPDPALDRAARVLLQLWMREHPLPRGAALRALVAHSGGVIWDHQIRRLSSQRGSAHQDQIEAALKELAREQSLYRFGRATEAYQGRQWTLLLMTRHRVNLISIPRQISTGQPLSLSGCVSAGYRVSSLLSTLNEGPIKKHPISDQSGPCFDRQLRPPTEEGEWRVAISGEGPFGSAPLAQLRFFLGEPLQWPALPSAPALDPPFANLSAAEDEAFKLLNMHRTQAGQVALIRDPTLGEIARIHSDEMGDSQFFGHRSPNTGGPNDRLQQAAYSAISVGENLALGESIAEATQALLESVSHRRVMLSSVFTHAGLGLRREKSGWLLTQLFARPLQILSSSELKSHRAAIWRQFFPQSPPRRRRRLDQLVTRTIAHPKSSPRRLLDRATRAGVRGRLWAWQIELSDLEAPFELPERRKLRHAEEAALNLIQLDRSQPPYFRLLLLLKLK